MDLGLKGRTVLITGGTRGIGLACARRFVDEAATVLCTGTRPDSFPKGKEYRQIKWITVDFKNPSWLETFRQEIPDTVDVLVNNAGINRIKPIENATDQDLSDIYEINLKAPFLLCRELFPGMVQRRFGRIVNIGSIWTVITKAGRSIYTMAKHGLVGLTKTLAVEGAPHNVLVNAVSPGFTNTELTSASLSPEEMARVTVQIPMGRMADTDEMARVVAFLGSNANTYITGQNIVADGGFTHV